MYFLIESSTYIGEIVSHGSKREDLSSHFIEEAGRALSGQCITVFTYANNQETEIGFSTPYLHERVAELNQMMLSGTDKFVFRFNGEPHTDLTLRIQEYRL